jgi:hypothetical protein
MKMGNLWLFIMEELKIFRNLNHQIKIEVLQAMVIILKRKQEEKFQ